MKRADSTSFITFYNFSLNLSFNLWLIVLASGIQVIVLIFLFNPPKLGFASKSFEVSGLEKNFGAASSNERCIEILNEHSIVIFSSSIVRLLLSRAVTISFNTKDSSKRRLL